MASQFLHPFTNLMYLLQPHCPDPSVHLKLMSVSVPSFLICREYVPPLVTLYNPCYCFINPLTSSNFALMKPSLILVFHISAPSHQEIFHFFILLSSSVRYAFPLDRDTHYFPYLLLIYLSPFRWDITIWGWDFVCITV